MIRHVREVKWRMRPFEAVETEVDTRTCKHFDGLLEQVVTVEGGGREVADRGEVELDEDGVVWRRFPADPLEARVQLVVLGAANAVRQLPQSARQQPRFRTLPIIRIVNEITESSTKEAVWRRICDRIIWK